MNRELIHIKIPDFLKSTYIMLSESFPDGIREEEYWMVLYLLYDYIADENLAIVMSVLTDKPIAVISNDLYKVCQMEFDSELLDEAENNLKMHGFEEWKKEA